MDGRRLEFVYYLKKKTGSFYFKQLYISLRLGERNGSSFLKSVYCLSGLRIVRKNRQTPKYAMPRVGLFHDKAIFLYYILFFLYDPLTTSLHGLKKSIIHVAIKKYPVI